MTAEGPPEREPERAKKAKRTFADSIGPYVALMIFVPFVLVIVLVTPWIASIMPVFCGLCLLFGAGYAIKERKAAFLLLTFLPLIVLVPLVPLRAAMLLLNHVVPGDLAYFLMDGRLGGDRMVRPIVDLADAASGLLVALLLIPLAVRPAILMNVPADEPVFGSRGARLALCGCIVLCGWMAWDSYRELDVRLPVESLLPEPRPALTADEQRWLGYLSRTRRGYASWGGEALSERLKQKPELAASLPWAALRSPQLAVREWGRSEVARLTLGAGDVPSLLATARCEYPDARAFAVRQLGEMTPPPAEAVPVLLRILEFDPDEAVRREALEVAPLFPGAQLPAEALPKPPAAPEKQRNGAR